MALALGRAARSICLVVVGLSAVVVSLIECIVGVRRETLRTPSWLGYLTVVLAVTLVASGIRYLLPLDSLAVMAWVSLPLLLAWVLAWVLAIGGCLGARRP